ncbi:MAG: hypothetical protein FVQ81_13185 [Candidatus Glassbacteria bacterium]|nr:hypothetical protein [Candidatus Glassbacteria bacterium]
MTSGDGRHKLGSKFELRVHQDICRVTRTMLEGWYAARQSVQLQRTGYEVKKSVLQAEVADHLGISTRQLSDYCLKVPITLAKAIVLSRFCDDPQLLTLFAQYLNSIAVPMPLLDGEFDLARANEELAANMKEFTEAQAAALALGNGAVIKPPACRAIFKEGWEAIRQIYRVMLLAELLTHGKILSPSAAWAKYRSITAPILPVDPSKPRPGWEPDSGFSADEPERR